MGSKSNDANSEGNLNLNGNQKELEKKYPVVQNPVLYVAEMLATHIMWHVISYVVHEEMIYIRRFDLQDEIQCSQDINFVQEFSRFKVSLQDMKRMQVVRGSHNSILESVPGFSGELRITDQQNDLVDLKFNLESYECTTHFVLRGCTITTFPAESIKPPALAFSLSDKGYVPEVLWSHKFEDTSPAKMRRALVTDDAERGSRIISYIIVLRNLRLITKLSGKEFLSAWWQIVVGHRTLWTEDIHHCNVSPSNLMVYQTSDGRWIGVLNDFDLSLARDTPSGQERTGTVPFMALDLLTQEAIEGQVKHLYRHDAESFIWVLTWVSLCYERGMFIGKGAPLTDWLRLDAIGCHKDKSRFFTLGRAVAKPSSSHKDHWDFVQHCISIVSTVYMTFPRPNMPGEVVFQMLQANIRKVDIEPELLNICL